MSNKVWVNLANAHELLELVGISETEVKTIVRFRAAHGPIVDGQQLSEPVAVRGGGARADLAHLHLIARGTPAAPP
jgi:helix-hairpin-helix protein